jgi:hypothetical protein
MMLLITKCTLTIYKKVFIFIMIKIYGVKYDIER